MPEEEFEEFGRMTGETADIVVRKITFKGNDYIDIRKYLHGENYQGWSRKGISVRIESFNDLLEILNKIGEIDGQKKTKKRADL